MSSAYHIPVLLHASIQALITDPNGIYVDTTFGGGGHSREILQHLGPQGKLFCFDQDPDAQKNFHQAFSATNATFIPQNFRFMQKFLRVQGVQKVHGILADLGVSSHQFDEASRGFSTRFDAPLDMRMSKHTGTNAYDIINSSSAEELQHLFGTYGEVRNARQLAQAIISFRQLYSESGGIRTTGQLKQAAESVAKGELPAYLAQVFQAIRIAVNDEMRALQDMLEQSAEVLQPGGRLVVISYHSLEDRMVKNIMKTGRTDGEIIEDIMGRKSFPFRVISRKPITPEAEELRQNPRSRSAKLRIAEKI